MLSNWHNTKMLTYIWFLQKFNARTLLLLRTVSLCSTSDEAIKQHLVKTQSYNLLKTLVTVAVIVI